MIEASELAAGDVVAIKSLLALAKPGEIITYSAMSKAIGRDVHERRHVIVGALKQLQRERRMVFAAVPMEGYKRLNDAEIVATGADVLSRIRRQGRRGARKLACADFDQLTPEQRLQHNTRMTVLVMVAEVTSSNAIARVESAVKDHNAALPAAKAAVAAMGSIA